MTVTEKHLTVALTLSTMFIIFNIVAVTQGVAADYYSQIVQLIGSLMLAL